MDPRTVFLLTNAAIATGLVIELLRGGHWLPVAVSGAFVLAVANVAIALFRRWPSTSRKR